jgi:hypothetical protein
MFAFHSTHAGLRHRRFASAHLCRLATFVLAGFSLGHACAQSNGDDDSPITPYRPSVSSPAQLPVPGQLEAELGGLRMRNDDMRRSSLPATLKLAFSKEWGVVVSGEAHVWSRDLTMPGDAGRAQGAGDTNVVLKRAFIVDDATAFGIELGTKLHTASERIGSGHTDATLNTIFSRDIGPVHMDANLNATRLGAADDSASRIQKGASASFSGPLSDKWGLTGELSGTRRSGADSSAQWLAALTYSPTKRLTFDIGIARAFRPTPATMQFFTGIVFPITRLW